MSERKIIRENAKYQLTENLHLVVYAHSYTSKESIVWTVGGLLAKKIDNLESQQSNDRLGTEIGIPFAQNLHQNMMGRILSQLIPRNPFQ